MLLYSNLHLYLCRDKGYLKTKNDARHSQNQNVPFHWRSQVAFAPEPSCFHVFPVLSTLKTASGQIFPSKIRNTAGKNIFFDKSSILLQNIFIKPEQKVLHCYNLCCISAKITSMFHSYFDYAA